PAALISSSGCFEESLATSAISSAALTASMANCPIFPVAPTSATLMGSCAGFFSEDIWPSLVNVVSAAPSAAAEVCFERQNAGPNGLFGPAFYAVKRL